MKGFALPGTLYCAIIGAFVVAEGNDSSMISCKFAMSAKNSFRATVSVHSVMGSAQPYGYTIDPGPDADPAPVVETELCDFPS